MARTLYGWRDAPLSRRPRMAVKLTVNLSDEVAEALKKLAAKNDISVTEQLRRAISTEKWVTSVADDNDKKLLVEDKGQLKEVIFRP